jgi:ATP-dependent helicase/nuclease subunit A
MMAGTEGMDARVLGLHGADTAQRGAADPTASVWVAASAGTGKTKVLTDRVLSLMLAGTLPQRILCLTFTKAAAAEMSVRIAKELGTWAAAGEDELERHLLELLGRKPDDCERRVARQLFPRVLDAPGGMNIHTIHAFCQSILGRFPLEAGIAPHASVLDERDQAELMAMARDEVLVAAERDGGVLAAALAEVTRHVREGGFADLMQALATHRGRINALIGRWGSVARAADAVRACLGVETGETPEAVVAAACAEAIDDTGLRLACAALTNGTASDRMSAEVIARWLEASPESRVDLFNGYRNVFLTKNGDLRQRLITQNAAKNAPGAADTLRAEGERVFAAVRRCRAATCARATEAVLVLGDALITVYQKLKEARSLLDYDDLIACTANLLEKEGNSSWVLYKLDGGIDHVLIDEAQDTSPEQWRIVRALTSDFFVGDSARAGGRTVFAVGDVKQSIFSFQGADPAQFVANRDWFGDRVQATEGLWRPLSLQVSFRSTRAVLAAVDAVFAAPGNAAGVALDNDPIVHQAFRMLDGGSVEVWPPVSPRPADEPLPWKPPVERVRGDSPQTRLARLVAERIKIMTGGDEILESAGRPIMPGDIMVLVRHRTSFIEELVRALKNRHVAVAGVDRMILTEQMAVMDLMAVGRFVLLPGDDLTLASVLKGPLIGFDEDTLFRLAYGRTASLWETLCACAEDDDDPTLAAAHRQLSEFLAMADAMPPFEFYARLLGPLGGRCKLLARLGRDAEDPLAEFLDLALAFERIHASSLQGFLHWLDAGAVEIKRDLEQAENDAVRVMTVHGAKGLQAPIVFLPDTMQIPKQLPALMWPADGNGGEGLLWPPSSDACEDVALREKEACAQRQREEYRRLLYVAMTRARDRLIVCGWRGDRGEPDGCWYGMITRGLEAACNTLKLERVEDALLAAAGETDGASVLRITCAQEEQPPPAPGVAVAALRPLPTWARTAAAAEPEPPQPLAPSRQEDEPAVRSPLGDDGGRRFKRGRLVHRMLQSLPDLPPARRAAAAASFAARPVHGLSTEAQREIVVEVLAVLEHPEWAELFGPGSAAEVPLSGVVGGRVVSGQIDRLLVTDAEVTILDFKTDRPAPASPAAVPKVYCRQIAAYRAAIQTIYPDRPVRCALLWTDGPNLMVLDDGLLDHHAPPGSPRSRS